MATTATDPPSHGTLRVRVSDDLILDAGTWQLDVVADQRPIARITPPAMAMFQQVIAYLDHAWLPPAERALPFLHPLISPSMWSLTDLSRPVELPLRVSGGNGL